MAFLLNEKKKTRFFGAYSCPHHYHTKAATPLLEYIRKHHHNLLGNSLKETLTKILSLEIDKLKLKFSFMFQKSNVFQWSSLENFWRLEVLICLLVRGFCRRWFQREFPDFKNTFYNARVIFLKFGVLGVLHPLLINFLKW